MLSTPLRFLSLLPAELNLAIVLKSGQSFRWQKFPLNCTRPYEKDGLTVDLTASEEYAFGWRDRTVVVSQHGQ